MYKDKKSAVLKEALKGKVQNVKVVNKVELAEKEYKPMPPTIRLTTDDLPEIKNWKVGKTYKIILDVEQTSMSQGDEYFGEGGDDKKVRASFKITSVKAV